MLNILKCNRYGVWVVALLALSACQAVTEERTVTEHRVVHGTRVDSMYSTAELSDPNAQAQGTAVVDLGTLTDIGDLVERLTPRQLVFVGETHDRYEHHLNQLAIIRGLHQRHPDLVIGMEYFQQPFQADLDRFIAGEIDEKQFLRSSEYYQRWRYDYRLYRPILDYARNHRIPLIALNVPKEITAQVARQGLESLSESQRAQIPSELDRNDTAYEQRLKEIFSQHPSGLEHDFENFMDAQLLWDEGMAERAAAYFREHPDGHMVILAGSGHLMYGSGIPNRVQRRTPVASAIVINGNGRNLKPGIADYLLLPERKSLPRSGLLGVMLGHGEDAVRVQGFSDDSPAEKAGLKTGDKIRRIGDESIRSYPDIRLALLDHKPGETIRVEVEREKLLLPDKQLTYDVTLY